MERVGRQIEAIGSLGRLPAIALALMLPLNSIAHAIDICPDLWLSRNAMYNEAGQCFRSPLGQALFDNSDCTQQLQEVDKDIHAKVAKIRRYERENACNVDTERAEIDVHLIALRLLLRDHPVADGMESTCFGIRSNGLVPLHIAKNEASKITGYIEDGDTIDFFHESEGDWEFASLVRRDGKNTRIAGWLLGPIQPDHCRDFAG